MLTREEAERMSLDDLRRHVEKVRHWHDAAFIKDTNASAAVLPLARAELAALEPILARKEMTT